MFNAIRKTQFSSEDSQIVDRRKNRDRRSSTEDIRFPFIDDNHKLIMKDRRQGARRTSDANFGKNAVKAVGKIFKKLPQ